MEPTRLIRILVVDDEESIRESIGAFLEDYNFQVSLAESGEEALEVLKDSNYNLAIVDLRLPGISGESFMVQAHEILPGMKFIIHTGLVGYELSEELISLGITSNQIFFKPISDMTQLIDRIEELLI